MPAPLTTTARFAFAHQAGELGNSGIVAHAATLAKARGAPSGA